MSWLFKDPISSGLAQFDHAQSNSKNGPKAKKIKLPQIAPTNQIFMYLLAPFILQNFKKILRADPELWRCAIFKPKMVHLLWKFLGGVQTIIITFIYLCIGPFHCAKF